MTVNQYITVNDFKSFQRVTSVDTADDAVIATIIENVSRFIDQYTGRRFFASVETHLFDIPTVEYAERDTIYLDDDLLTLTTFTNGDSTTISSNDYLLKSVNHPPYYAVKLRNSSNVAWQPNAAGSGEQVLSILGVWGWHDRYSKAWLQVGTLGAAISSTTTLTFTMTAGHAVTAGQILMIDAEYMNAGGVSTNTITAVTRSDNGSTAATHLNGAPVYAWQAPTTITQVCQIITNSLYKKRFGENTSSAATITAAGVVITPTDIPTSALTLLRSLMRQS